MSQPAALDALQVRIRPEQCPDRMVAAHAETGVLRISTEICDGYWRKREVIVCVPDDAATLAALGVTRVFGLTPKRLLSQIGGREVEVVVRTNAAGKLLAELAAHSRLP